MSPDATIIIKGKRLENSVRRRFVPITFAVTGEGERISFEQKLPFQTDRVVGIITVINGKEKGNNIPDRCIPGQECDLE